MLVLILTDISTSLVSNGFKTSVNTNSSQNFANLTINLYKKVGKIVCQSVVNLVIFIYGSNTKSKLLFVNKAISKEQGAQFH